MKLTHMDTFGTRPINMLTLLGMGAQVHPFLEHSCAILSSFKIVIISNNTSADFVLISANVIIQCYIENYHNFETTKDRATVF